jgi:hypothetical protein
MKARAKPKTAGKPAKVQRLPIARLVPSRESDIDDEAEDRQRGGVDAPFIGPHQFVEQLPLAVLHGQNQIPLARRVVQFADGTFQCVAFLSAFYLFERSLRPSGSS